MLRAFRTVSAFVLVAGAVLCAAGTASAATPPVVSPAAAHGFGAIRPASRVAPSVVMLDSVPGSVDLRQWAVPPGDQGQVSSCVTWAIDYSMLGWYSRYSGRAGQPFAPMYTYSQINGGVDAGSIPTDALQVAVTQGSDTRAHYTQGDFDWIHKPTAAERANAAQFKIKGFETLFAGSNQSGNISAVTHALATRHPVAIEMAVRHGFEYLGSVAAATDTDDTSAILGYHEVLAVGYDSAGLVIENSWGSGWADGGFGRISWSVVQHDVWEADTIDGFVSPPTPAPATPPTTTTPSISSPTRVGADGRASVTKTYKVAWKGTAGTSGAITRYDAWYQVDGKAFVGIKLASATSSSFALSTRTGHRYRVAVRADSATKRGAIRYSAAFLVVR